MESLKNFEDRAPREATLAAYAALADEQRQLRSIEQRAQELECAIAEAPAAVAVAEKAVLAANTEQLRGIGTATDVQQAKGRLGLARQSLAEAREQLSLVRRAREDANTRIRAAKAAAQRARDAQSAQLFDAIATAIRDDAKLRRRLLLAFTAVRLTNDADVGVVGRPNWYGVLEEIFPPPTDEELEAVSADAGGRFPRLADFAEAVAA